MIFFVAAVIVAGAVSGIFIVVTTSISGSLHDNGERVVASHFHVGLDVLAGSAFEAVEHA